MAASYLAALTSANNREATSGLAPRRTLMSRVIALQRTDAVSRSVGAARLALAASGAAIVGRGTASVHAASASTARRPARERRDIANLRGRERVGGSSGGGGVAGSSSRGISRT